MTAHLTKVDTDSLFEHASVLLDPNAQPCTYCHGHGRVIDPDTWRAWVRDKTVPLHRLCPHCEGERVEPPSAGAEVVAIRSEDFADPASAGKPIEDPPVF